jgi:dephospho-CoA kinase
MIVIGLTGGIGSGKSTVAKILKSCGAEILDADAIVHELQAPGTPLLKSLVQTFGMSILSETGELLRKELATLIFSDVDARRQLNTLVHPAVQREMGKRLRIWLATSKVVVVDIPLLAESPREGFGAVLVVDCPEAIVQERLQHDRAMSVKEIAARIAAQVTRAQRRSIATHVIDNVGSQDELEEKVMALWPTLQKLAPATEQDVVRICQEDEQVFSK